MTLSDVVEFDTRVTSTGLAIGDHDAFAWCSAHDDRAFPNHVGATRLWRIHLSQHSDARDVREAGSVQWRLGDGLAHRKQNNTAESLCRWGFHILLKKVGDPRGFRVNSE